MNGRFGFGVHAFRAAANLIRFRTKHADDAQVELVFTRHQQAGIRPPAAVRGSLPTATGTGTVVTLSGFDAEVMRELSAESIRREIELHFERLLARPNLRIEVSQDDTPPVRCRPFDYDSHPGTVFRRTLAVAHGGVTFPVEVHLKVCEAPIPNLLPRFFGRGRRINEARYIRSFIGKSRHRTAVWAHDHLVGYIEVGEAVAPVITRDDFERTVVRTMLYEKLLPLEDELKAALDAVNRQQHDQRLTRLEDAVRDALSRIARADDLRFRTEVAGRGQDVPAAPDGGAASGPDAGSPAGERKESGGGSGGGGEGGGTGPQPGGNGPMPGDQAGGLPRDPGLPHQPPTATTRRKSGFDIKFMDMPAPPAPARPARSKLIDGTIYINVAHPDFRERLAESRRGQFRLNERLVNYLAGVVSIHYKDQYYEKYRNQPERLDTLFDEQIDFICRLEAALVPHIAALQSRLDEHLVGEAGHGHETAE